MSFMHGHKNMGKTPQTLFVLCKMNKIKFLLIDLLTHNNLSTYSPFNIFSCENISHILKIKLMSRLMLEWDASHSVIYL